MRFPPRNFSNDGQPDGDYAVHIAGGEVSWGTIPATGVSSITVVSPLRIDTTDSAHPVLSMMGFLVADDGTDFSIVFDDLGEPIYVEDS